jgi:hypothetical protein
MFLCWKYWYIIVRQGLLWVDQWKYYLWKLKVQMRTVKFFCWIFDGYFTRRCSLSTCCSWFVIMLFWSYPFQWNIEVIICNLLFTVLWYIWMKEALYNGNVVSVMYKNCFNPFFGELGSTNRFITKNRYNRNFDTPFEICFFFSFKTIYDMSCHLLTES